VYRPRHELQNVAPRNFDAFFAKGSGKKRQSKFLRCRAAKGRPAFAIPGFGRAIFLLSRNQATNCERKKDHDRRTKAPQDKMLAQRLQAQD
jgi:hypothetical protein